MKEIIYTPIIITEADLSMMASGSEQAHKEQHEKVVDMWKGIESKIDNMNLPYKMVKIFQDSLPLMENNMEMKIAEEVADRGSLNHKLILNLVSKGATLIGTEDLNLLNEERNNFQKLTAPASSTAEKVKNIKSFKTTSEELLIKRDKFIAKRIEDSLNDEEIGILFIGIRHKVDKYLQNIKISYLIHRLPFKERYEVTMGQGGE